MNQKPKSNTSSQIASVVNLPGYKIKDVLGKGGMAIVYLAVQESIGREVALKILVPDHTDETFTDRFLREARIVSSLNHPNIITVYDAGVHQGCHYISMEYAPGKSLRDIRDQLTRKQKVVIIKQVAQALDYAGKKGYVHRDIKPENILLHDRGRAILTDFGIARSLNVTQGLTVTGKAIGTPYYMSPEQTKGIKVDHRSDIYSLGVVLFQALAGYLPYDGPSLVAIGIKHISEPIPELPAGLDIFQPIINIALSKDPAHRYASAAEFYNALNAITESDLDYIDARAAALKKKGQDYQAKTISTSSSIIAPSKKPLQDEIKIRAQRHTHPGDLDITTTEEYQRLGRRRRLIILFLLLLSLAGFGIYRKELLSAKWQQYVQPEIDQLLKKQTTSKPGEIIPQPAQTPVKTMLTPLPSDATDHNHTATINSTETFTNRTTILQQLNDDPALAESLAQQYHSLLSQNPEDSSAVQGMEQLAGWYLLQIRTAADQKNSTEARTLILQAKQNLTSQFVPPQILLLEEQLLRQEAIHSHLEKAKQYYSQAQYISPQSQNARDEWLAVLSIDQNQVQAQQGLESITSHYHQLARQQYQSAKYIEALASIESGLSAHKQNPQLLTLKHEIDNAIEKQNRILSLITRAEAEFQAGKMLKPENENAYDLYTLVRKEQATNPKARTGLLKIEDYLNRQINTAIWENKLKLASLLLKQAQSRFPNSAKLDMTRAKLQNAVQTRAPRVTHVLFSELPISTLLNEQSELTPSKILHIGFTYTNLSKSTTLLLANLIDPDNKVLEKKLIVSDKSGEHIFSIEHPRQQFEAGNYRLIIKLDEQVMLNQNFTIDANSSSHDTAVSSMQHLKPPQ